MTYILSQLINDVHSVFQSGLSRSDAKAQVEKLVHPDTVEASFAGQPMREVDALGLHTYRQVYYAVQDSRGRKGKLPRMYSSNAEAAAAVKKKLAVLLHRPTGHMGNIPALSHQDEFYEAMIDAGWIMTRVSTLESTSVIDDASRMMIWSYDANSYEVMATSNTMHYLVTKLAGYCQEERIRNFAHYVSMCAEINPDAFITYRDLPKYYTPVANGNYNSLTGELEPLTPLYVVRHRLDTPFVDWSDKPAPELNSGLTWEAMLEGYARTETGAINYDRLFHLNQIIYESLLGWNKFQKIVMLIGRGGDGKSTLMRVLQAVVGSRRVSNAHLASFASKDFNSIGYDLNSKGLILGMDNTAKLSIAGDTERNLKSVSGGDTYSVVPKYLNAVSCQYTGMILQATNAIPTFPNGLNEAVKRRFEPILFERSYTERGEAVESIVDEVTLGRPDMREYILWYTLTRQGLPALYSHHHAVDARLMERSAIENDTTYEFLTWCEDSGLLDPDMVGFIPRGVFFALYQTFVSRATFDRQDGQGRRKFWDKATAFLAERGWREAQSPSGAPTKRTNMSLEKEHGPFFRSLVSAQGEEYAAIVRSDGSRASEWNDGERVQFFEANPSFTRRRAASDTGVRAVSVSSFFSVSSAVDRIVERSGAVADFTHRSEMPRPVEYYTSAQKSETTQTAQTAQTVEETEETVEETEETEATPTIATKALNMAHEVVTMDEPEPVRVWEAARVLVDCAEQGHIHAPPGENIKVRIWLSDPHDDYVSYDGLLEHLRVVLARERARHADSTRNNPLIDKEPTR